MGEQGEGIVGQARDLIQQGQHREAIDLLEPWLSDNPEDSSGWAALGAACFELEDWGRAERAAREVVHLRPDSAREWCNLGVVLRKLGKVQQAAGMQRRALALDSAYARAHVELKKLRKLGAAAKRAEGPAKKPGRAAPATASGRRTLPKALVAALIALPVLVVGVGAGALFVAGHGTTEKLEAPPATETDLGGAERGAQGADGLTEPRERPSERLGERQEERAEEQVRADSRRGLPQQSAGVQAAGCPGGWTGKVVGVQDGDTISVMHSGHAEKIRLHGIDCPESGQDFGRRAKQFTSGMVFGKEVCVKATDVDRYGRTVAKVYTANGKSLNLALAAAGLAWWYRKYAPNDKALAELEAQARQRQIGIWSYRDPIPPWEWRHPTTTRSTRPAPAPSARPSPAPSASGAGPFVGSKNSDVYHYPDCQHARRIKASNLVTYSSSEEARAKGKGPCKVCCPP